MPQLSKNYRPFYLLAFAFSCLVACLFYAQATSEGAYLSDLPSHVGIALKLGQAGSDSYSLLHLLTAGLGELIMLLTPLSSELAYSYSMVVLLAGAELATVLLIFHLFTEREISPLRAGTAALTLVVAGMLLIQWAAPQRYIDSLSPNPWHNPTFLFARPFAIWFYWQLLKTSGSRPLVIGLAGFLAMWAKPSFMLSALPAATLLYLYEWQSDRINRSAFLRSNLALLPALLPLAFVFWQVYQVGSTDDGIIVAPGRVWSMYSDFIPFSILKAMLFPALALLLIRPILLQRNFAFVWLNGLLAFLLYFLLAESGERMAHANFAWTYSFGLFFIYLECTFQMLAKRAKVGWRHLVVGFVFLAHLLSGIVYLVLLFSGREYF